MTNMTRGKSPTRMTTVTDERARGGMTNMTCGKFLSGMTNMTRGKSPTRMTTVTDERARGGMTNVTYGSPPNWIKTQSMGPLPARPGGGLTTRFICSKMTYQGSELVIPKEADTTPLHSTQPGHTMLRILASTMMTRLGDTTVNWLVEPGGEEVSKGRLES
jgi:hypothetical protein